MRFLHSSATTIMFKALSMFCGFGASVLIARALGPEGRGTYGIMMTVIVLSNSFGLFGFAGANAYLIARDNKNARAVGTQSLMVGGAGTILAFAALMAAASLAPQLLGGLQGPAFWITLLMIPMFLWGTLFSYSYLGNDRIVAFNLFETGQRLIFFVSAIIVLTFLGNGFSSYVSVVLGSLALMTMCYIVLYFTSAPKGTMLNLALVPGAVSYGIRSYVATVVTYAVMRSGIFFVSYYRGTAEAGMFSVAQQMSELLVIAPSVISTVLFSRIAREQSRGLTARVLRTSAIVLFPIMVVCALTRRSLIMLLFGAEFLPAAETFLIMLPGAFLLGMEVLMAADIAGRGYPWPAALAWIPVLAMNLTGYVILIPKYGINGAAAATTVSFLAITVFMVFYYKKISGQRWSTMFLVRHDDLRALSSMIFRSSQRNVITEPIRKDANQALHHKSESEVQRVTS